MAWNEAVITDSGLSVLAEGILEGSVLITSAAGGESCSSADLLSEMSEIAAPLHTLNTAGVGIDGGKAVVRVRVQNKGVRESFVLRQIGLFAKIKGSKASPVLMAVIQDKNGEVVPSEKENPEFLLEFDLVIPIENKGNMEIVLSPNTFATLEDLEERDGVISLHTENRENPHGVTKEQVGLGNVPNVSTDNQTPTYTVAANLSELSSGEKLSAAFGKIAKAVKTIIVHIADNARHITAAERTDWNGKAAGNHTHTAATQSAAGLMSAADKSKLDGLSTYAKGIRGYTFLSDLNAGKYLRVLSVQLGDYRYYKYFTALLALNSFFASGSSSDKTKLDMIVSLDAKQSSTNLDNIEFYAYSNAVPAMFNTERFIAAYKRVNTTDVLFEVYIRLVYDYEYFSANVINSYTLPTSPIDFPMALVDEIPSDMTTSTLYVNKTDINALSVTAEKAGLMSAADKSKLDGIAAGANKYIHPTSAGSKHIPAGGSSGQILKWSEDGTAAWGTYMHMLGASASVDGASGVVPVPMAGMHKSYLRGDGCWRENYGIASTGKASFSSSGFSSYPRHDVSYFQVAVECTSMAQQTISCCYVTPLLPSSNSSILHLSTENMPVAPYCLDGSSYKRADFITVKFYNGAAIVKGGCYGETLSEDLPLVNHGSSSGIIHLYWY